MTWSNHFADKDKNSSTFLSYRGHLVFRHFVAFAVLWEYPSPKMKWTPLEVTNYLMEVKTFQLTKIEKRPLSIFAAQAWNF